MLELKVGESYYNYNKQKVTICLLSDNVYTGNLCGKFIRYNKNGIAKDDIEYDLIFTAKELTFSQKNKCKDDIDNIQKALYRKFLPVSQVQDLLNMIVESEDIYQSIADFVEAEELA